MSHIDDLIAELCPEGVEFRSLEKACLSIRAGGDLPSNFAKGQLEPTPEFPYPIYSNGTAANALYGYADSYRIDAEVVTVSARGTIGSHTVRRGKFTPIVRLITLEPNPQILNVDFLDYALDITEIGHSGGSIPQLTVPAIKRIRIPVPPMEVQREIVRILDTFSALETELEAELEARRIQYAHYRDSLVAAHVHMNTARLKDVALFRRGTAITEKQANPGDIPVVANGPVSTYSHNESNRSGETIVVARSGAYAGLVSYWNQPIFLTDAFSVHPKPDTLTPKFIYYFLQSAQHHLHSMKKGAGVPHVRVKEMELYEIPIPSLVEQERIVGILDNFDALVNDISIGLPAELVARRKQYEHYRDRLLTFEEAPA